MEGTQNTTNEEAVEMAKIDFYNVKKRAKVKIEESDCKKTVYKRKTSKGLQERYAVRATDDDGTNLTKFMSKDDFDRTNCPVV